ncbi:MAG: cytochrome c oxidase subunit II [Candidatus Eremiobacteraeota bacterium]|nr:cytochrome c oxidase subunit II [Candidatus Eremiobacteraeota bacterium]
MQIFNPATVQGATLRGDWIVFLIAAAVVGAVLYGLIIGPLIVWRRRSDDDPLPPQFNKNQKWSVAYISIPLLIVIGLFYVTYTREKRVEALVPAPYAIVDVTAFRWSWRFRYPQAGITITGTPRADPLLVLPVDQTTQVNLYAADVTHSMWIPAFLFKRDAIPGMANHFDFRPTRTGEFRGLCAQYCGLDHALMHFNVKVVSDQTFQRWLGSHGSIAL